MITTLNASFVEWFQQYGAMVIIFVLIIAAFVLMMVFQNKKRKKQEKEAKDLIDAVKPGNKVKTIGGVCGIVVEVDAEENTFVLETGSVETGKSYIKFDKQAIFDTDAAPEPAPAAEDAEQPAEAGETPAGADAADLADRRGSGEKAGRDRKVRRRARRRTRKRTARRTARGRERGNAGGSRAGDKGKQQLINNKRKYLRI